MYSSPQTAPSGAYTWRLVFGLMFTWTTPFVKWAVTRFFTPPRLTSVARTVAFVPSSNVRTAADQSSTSCQSCASHFLGSARKAGVRVRCPTSAITDRTRVGRPDRRRPSWCFRWITAPIG
jgi:hypothetical protein